eukprot:CAMPEP_0184310762 /NCGR_PEP_ID=MMETSP1049-20130417/34590_1 /TAXON_ID=77928 /ORGANISM="Proteomonas sulcata, Strain CCMP704" /LENGTH=141 /DNA_ID=CAMNT_0026625379 /DNA_START=251 /DNA_END=676 /DNA_ORIENTATION=+
MHGGRNSPVKRGGHQEDNHINPELLNFMKSHKTTISEEWIDAAATESPELKSKSGPSVPGMKNLNLDPRSRADSGDKREEGPSLLGLKLPVVDSFYPGQQRSGNKAEEADPFQKFFSDLGKVVDDWKCQVGLHDQSGSRRG